MNVTPIQHRSKLTKGMTIYQVSHNPHLQTIYQEGKLVWVVSVAALYLHTDPYQISIDGVVDDWAVDVSYPQALNPSTIVLDDVLGCLESLTTWYIDEEAAELTAKRQREGDYTTQERIALSKRTEALTEIFEELQQVGTY